METLLVILPLLACPLAMALIAGAAWAWAKVRPKQAPGQGPHHAPEGGASHG
jgi:hypothetical protein